MIRENPGWRGKKPGDDEAFRDEDGCGWSHMITTEGEANVYFGDFTPFVHPLKCFKIQTGRSGDCVFLSPAAAREFAHKILELVGEE